MEKKIINCPNCGVEIDLETQRAYYILEKKYNSLQEKLETALKQIDIIQQKLSQTTKKISDIDSELK